MLKVNSKLNVRAGADTERNTNLKYNQRCKTTHPNVEARAAEA